MAYLHVFNMLQHTGFLNKFLSIASLNRSTLVVNNFNYPVHDIIASR